MADEKFRVIPLKESHRMSLAVEIARVQRGTGRRTLDVSALFAASLDAEYLLQTLCIPRRFWTHSYVLVIASWAHDVSDEKSILATKVTLMRRTNGWTVTRVERGPARASEKTQLYLSTEAQKSIPMVWVL